MYAGDISVEATWKALQTDKEALMVDVRTEAEWTFVGVPDLTGANKELICVEWQFWPGGQQNDAFVPVLKGILDENGAARENPLYFLCRSGVRSKAAAIAMTQEGYQHCFNVSGGFEGGHDEHAHRGRLDGWKAGGLPWKQP